MEKININTAGVRNLKKIIHIGDVRAKAIIRYRTLHGKYKDKFEISNVPYIGQKRAEDILKQDLIEV